MPDTFMIRGSIPAVRDSVPIRFVHHRNWDKPENHVLHLNNYLELYVYVEGNHHFIVENKLYELHRGDVILINPREVHKALPLESGIYERFYLLLDVHCLDGMVCNPLTHILNLPQHMGNLLSADPEHREQLLGLLYDLSDCFSKERDRQVRALGLILQLLDLCNNQLAREQSAQGRIVPVPQLLERILAYVAENTATIQTTTQVAEALGLSSQYLSAYFSKHIGTPLKIYIQAKKVALAKELLNRGADVTQACFDSGFNDCSYFIRVFKKYVGVTPLRYQQSLYR